MKKITKVLSYLLVAVMASLLTLAVTYQEAPGVTKLQQLEDMILEKFIGDVDRTALENNAAAAMVASTGDRWSYYIPASEYAAHKEQSDNAYVGIGITIQLTQDGEGFLIVKVNEGGPAEQAGLLAGDVIIGIEGQDTAGMTTTDARNLVRGKEGTQVQLKIRREYKDLDIPVTRKQVITPVTTAKLLDGGYGLITIANFNARCAQETTDAIEQMLGQGATSLIFDLRFNPGGYADELVKVLDYLLPEGDLFRTVDYRGKEDVDRSDAKCLTGVPIAVLVNGESYSAAEFFAAALREYGVAVVVGERTVGKGYYQRTYELNDGSAVGLSVGKYFTPKGVSLAEEGGLIPDVEIPVDQETAAAIYAGTQDPMTDPQIQAAMDALK